MTSLMLIDTFSVDTGFAIAVVGLSVLSALAVVALVLAAVFSILLSSLDGGMKIVWLVLVVLAPVIGALLWFFIGRSRAARTHRMATR